MYKKAVVSFWPAEEMDSSGDLHDWTKKLNNNERRFVSHVLAFFTASDDVANGSDSRTYSLLVDAYVKDPARREYLFDAVETIPCVKKKVDWAFRWTSDTRAIR
jgi:ribonucleoside-diphosphate reductase subunit M2